jgi:hypothetical protein
MGGFVVVCIHAPLQFKALLKKNLAIVSPFLWSNSHLQIHIILREIQQSRFEIFRGRENLPIQLTKKKVGFGVVPLVSWVTSI